MKFHEWMIGAVVIILTVAMAVGSVKSTIDEHERHLISIEEWKEKASNQLSRLDEKMDMLLEANGLKYGKTKWMKQ